MFKVEVRENTQYEDNSTTHYLEVVDGKYEGMHFTFGKIEFLGEDDEGNGKIEFDYTLLNLPEPYSLDEERDEIEEVVSQVLRYILEQNTNKETEEGADETGNLDSEQSS